MVDNSEAKVHASGVEIVLMRQFKAEGYNHEMVEEKQCKFKEILMVKSQTFDIKCKKNDKNVFKFDFELPLTDSISWMPKNLTADQEETMTYFTPTIIG